MQIGQIFLSYSRADSAFALKLGEDLKNAGIDIWIDQTDIRPSEPWDEEIEKALQESQGMLIILSKTSVASDNVLNEINYALESKKQVYPILLEKGIKKPLNIIRLQHVDFTGSYEKGFVVLLSSLQAGKPINSLPKRSSRMIISIAIITVLIIIAGLIFRMNSNRSGKVETPTLDNDSAKNPADVTKRMEVNVTGIWTTNEVTNPFDEFDKYIIDFDLEALDSTIHGSIIFRSSAKYKNYYITKGLLGGKIEHNRISFYTIQETTGITGNVQYRDYYHGSIIDSLIKFTLQSDRPGGFPGQRFVALKNTGKK